MQDLTPLISQAQKDITAAANLLELERIKTQYLGKKGELTELLKSLGQLSAEERPRAGQVINQAKQAITTALEEKLAILEAKAVEDSLRKQTLDVTLPGRGQNCGSLHPVTLTRQRIEGFFIRAGFEVVEGPEIEDDFHNFEALNIPKHHPARAMHDTFYLEENDITKQTLLLRTHTSSVQIRVMKESKPPLRMIMPGRVYRCDSDMTHTPMFNQIEGLVIDDKSSFADLKGLLHDFMKDFFGRELKMRFRPSYFPFTEPSAEADIECVLCDGIKDCRVCKNTRWLEVLGCGMVHPNVLKAVGIDAEQYTGFAFGMGMDRLTMLRYQIPDLRMMFENDQRFLEQFA